ncbi:roadblock/LC7 domain-containing protein [Streptomyces plicatus]|uniref:histidine kinase n=1 Tax=Streptomyces plicatus TaxID=1922 RepID=A0ABW1XR40_STRPL
MTAPARSGDRPAPPPLLTVALPCAVVSALAVGGAVAAAPSSVRVPLALGASAAAILLCVAVTVAVHAVRSERATRRLLDAARADAEALVRDRAGLAKRAARDQEALRGEAERERDRLLAEFDGERRRLADGFEQERRRLAEEFERESDRLTADFARERALLTEERDREVARLTEETARLRARLDRATGERAAAVSATANAAGRMQALATGMLADLRAMEERHSDEDVLADLLHLDHRTAQAGRLADSVAVLTGARSGRRWARPIGMESILRGAMGRIAGYQRVRVHAAGDASVAGHAAEGVMHALAELLDNAVNFSPPTAEVHVYVEEVPAGVIVSVEDSGLVMGEVQLRRAQQAVSGESAGLGGLTGTRLGLAVVGRLSAKYGLKVSFRPSARGGTGVLMLIPRDILGTPAVAPAPTPSAAAPAPAARGAVARVVADRRTPVHAAGGPLPRRTGAHRPRLPHSPTGRGRLLARGPGSRAGALARVGGPGGRAGVLARVRGPGGRADGAGRGRRAAQAPPGPHPRRRRTRTGGRPGRRAAHRPARRRREDTRGPLQQLPPGRTGRRSHRPGTAGRRRAGGPHRPHPDRDGPRPPVPLARAPGRRHHSMTGSTTADDKLTWLIEGLLERTPGARHALVLSRDGLKLCRTPELSVDQADQLAAIAAGIQSLSHGASVEFGDGSGGVRSAMTEFYGGILFIVEAGEGAHLAVVTSEDADAGLVGHNMSELIEQLGEHLTAQPRTS